MGVGVRVAVGVGGIRVGVAVGLRPGVAVDNAAVVAVGVGGTDVRVDSLCDTSPMALQAEIMTVKASIKVTCRSSLKTVAPTFRPSW